MNIKVIYTFFLGLIVALFIGFGFSVFYQAPEQPEYPLELREYESKPLPNATPESEETRKLRLKYEQEQQTYHQDTYPAYNRNLSIGLVISAVIILIVSLTLLNHIQILSDGLLLGGIMTLLYAMIRSFMGENNVYSFAVVTVGLLVALVLGYIKFMKHDKQKA